MYVTAVFSATTHPVATLWPEEYSAGTRVIQFESDALATSECAKFAVKPDLDGAGWAVKQSTVYGNLATATVYVDGSATTDGSGTKASPCKYLATAIGKVTMANSTIIVKNSTNETGDITIPNEAKYKGLTIKSAQGATGVVINGSSYELTVRAGIKIENLSFNSWGGINIYATDKVTLNDVSVYFGQSFSGGALYLDSDAEVEAQNLTISGCKATGTHATAGGIYVGTSAILTVDGLKVINDTYGHKEGDATILAISDTIELACGAMDVCGRIGGDEFVIVGRGEGFAKIFEDRFNAELERKNKSSGKPYLLDASIGHITSIPEDDDTLLEFIQQADAEMYQVKKTKKNHR